MGKPRPKSRPRSSPLCPIVDVIVAYQASRVICQYVRHVLAVAGIILPQSGHDAVLPTRVADWNASVSPREMGERNFVPQTPHLICDALIFAITAIFLLAEHRHFAGQCSLHVMAPNHYVLCVLCCISTKSSRAAAAVKTF